MSLGAALLQPQRFRRVKGRAAGDALVDDFVQLAARLALDPEQAKPLLDALEQAFGAMVQRFLERDGLDADRALGRLRTWAQPLLDGVDTVQADLADVDDVGDAVAALADLAASLAQVAETLTLEQIRASVTELLDILETEFGLTTAWVEEQVWIVLDDVVETVGQAGPADAPRDVRATRRALATFLKRLKRRVRGKLTLPPLNADQVAEAVLDVLRRGGLETFAQKGGCVAEAVRDAATAGSTLVEAAGVAGFGPSTVGAAQAPQLGDEYRWYASWLCRSAVPGFPGTDVWRTADKTQIVERPVFGDDVCLHQGTDVEWDQAPRFSDPTLEEHYTFTDKLDPAFMEGWARYTSPLITDLTKLVLHFTSVFEKGDRASNISFASWTTANGTFDLIAGRPFVSWLNSSFGGPQWTRWPLAWIVPLAIAFLASLESRQTKADERKGLNWFVLFLDDGLEALTYDIVGNLLRDLFLSIFTLINYKESETPAGETRRPLNSLETAPLVTLVGLGTGALLMLLIDRKDYNHPFKAGVGVWLGVGIIVNAIFTVFGVIAGVLLSSIFMRAVDPKAFPGPLLFGPLVNVALFLVGLPVFLSKEGDTDGGKYNPRGGGFNGYPDPSASPYRLPYEKGETVFCPQGNQGMISHNRITNDVQVYAFDFALDQGEEILAVRPGTVVDFFDWVPDDQNVNTPAPAATDPSPPSPDELPDANQTLNDNWNFVLVRHDVDDSSNPVAPDATHDLGAGGATVTSFAVYGHGRNGSVRELLTPSGGAVRDIIGVKVKQGQPIMRSGHTGISAFNHLHFHVQPGPAPPTPVPAVTAPVTRATLTKPSIPVVFREVTHSGGLQFLKPGAKPVPGVPKTFGFYTSDNEKKTG